MFSKITRHVYLFWAGQNDRPNVALIVGSKFAMLWDAGFSADHVAEIKHAIDSQNLRMPDYIVLSHSHADHVLGCSAWDGIPVICGKETNEILKKMSALGWSEKEMQHRVETGEEIEFMKAMIMQEFQDPEHEIEVVTGDIVFEDLLEVTLGENLHIDLIHCASPHCSDNILALVREDQLLLISDSAGKDLYARPWHYYRSFREATQDIPYDPDKVQAFITTINQLPFQFYVDGHTPKVGFREGLLNPLRFGIKEDHYE